jgi:hypothetical protein
MRPDPSEKTAVLAVYPAVHYADMAQSYLKDNEIDAFVASDSSHVTLQMTEGARLVVMESHAEAARALLTEAKLLPGDIAAE